MMDLSTYAENTWCPGCGNFGILNAFKNAVKMLTDEGIERGKIAISAGIGCHGKIFDYLNLSGLYSIHGRSVATIEGMKIANPRLKCVSFVGDGDAMGEGLSHLLFTAKRNVDITVIMHNNGVYALTTGQFTPLSEKGFKSKTSLGGNIEEPFNPLLLLLVSGASFIARGYSGRLEHLSTIIKEAILHKGFSFVEVLQPCVSYNDTYKYYNERVEVVEDTLTYEEALKIIREKKGKIPLGILYRAQKPIYHEELYGSLNPVEQRMSRKERLDRVKGLLSLY